MRIALVINKYGDLGNRLFRFARLYHQTSKTGIILIDISLYQYVWYFKPKNLFYRIIFFFQKLIGELIFVFIQKSKNKITSNSWIKKIQIPVGACIDDVGKIFGKSKNIFLFIECSEIECNKIDLDANEKKELKKIFSIDPKLQKTAEKILCLDKSEYIYVGVHIRQGDYRKFANGTYFYESHDYARELKKLKRNCNFTKKLRFAVVSNEKVERRCFEGLDVVYGCSNDPLIDFAILHQCDYIVSTHSSFSAWPSLINNIPKTIIRTGNTVSWEKFHKSKLNYWIS